jgi:hypothetical protein
VPRRQNLCERDFAGHFAQLLNVVQGFLDLGLAAAGFRHDAGDRLTVARDDEGLAALDLIEQAGKIAFSFGRLDFTHRPVLY